MFYYKLLKSRMEQPKIVDDTVVSYIDLYRTLGEVIGYKGKGSNYIMVR